MFDRYLARAIGEVRPAVPQVAEPRQLAAVVPSHVPPTLRGAVVSEPAVEFDVEVVLVNDDVQELNAVADTPYLTTSFGEPMTPSYLGVLELQH